MTPGLKSPRERAQVAGLTPVTHVLFCADRRYIEHASVAAVSVASAARRTPLRIHVMSCDADAASAARLRSALRPFGHVDVAFHPVEPERLAGLFADKHLSKEAYLRFLAPEALPPDVDRVIYLDCDVIALDDVSALFAADLGGKAVGAVPDIDWSDHAQTDRLLALGIRPDQPYVNSGVLVMDLGEWRRRDLSRRLLAFAAQKGSLLLRHDQDALNALLGDEIAVLDRRWNVQVILYSRYARRALPRDHAASVEARRRPSIVHFSTDEKPWKFRAWTRKKALYFRFRDLTPWRDEPPPGLSRAQWLEHDAALWLLRRGVDVYAVLGAARRLGTMAARFSGRRLPAAESAEPGAGRA